MTIKLVAIKPPVERRVGIIALNDCYTLPCIEELFVNQLQSFDPRVIELFRLLQSEKTFTAPWGFAEDLIPLTYLLLQEKCQLVEIRWNRR